MHKIAIIIRKEWAEVFKNRMVLFTVAFMPLLLTAIPLIILVTTGSIEAGSETAGDFGEMPEQIGNLCPPELKGMECMQVYLVSQFMLMFMILPLAIPVTIAAYSIVGEKTTRSLEPLLATPITTIELLLGKSLAAVIPAVAATDLAFAIFAAGAWLIVREAKLLTALLDARWLLAVLVVGPLMALAAVCVSVIVSSRVNDPRVAEQISMVVIVPLLAIFFGQLAGLVYINRQFVLAMAAILLVLDMALFYAAERLFQRETILTRWK